MKINIIKAEKDKSLFLHLIISFHSKKVNINLDFTKRGNI